MECLRCTKEFEKSVPKVTNPKGVKEIATREYCAECNAFVMSILYRGNSAYDILPSKREGDRDGI